jgi:transposase InsO family protein
MAEAFFATLECELLDRRSFRSQAEARMAVFHFIDGFYNPTRRHSALGYLYPSNTKPEPWPRTADPYPPTVHRSGATPVRGSRLAYSTVTLFARLRGWSTSVPFRTAT